MQFVKTADLRPGMRLAKPIYNKMGVLLYERNTKLTMQGITSVENFGLIGIFILEPAEPVPPLSKEDIEFEQFQTIYMFKVKDCMDKLMNDKPAPGLSELSKSILERYGHLDHKLNFTQNLRSSADFAYKHSISAAILTAMIAFEMKMNREKELSLITAALLYDLGYLFVPHIISQKGDELTDKDQSIIQSNLEKGYELIKRHAEESEISKLSLEIIRQYIHDKNPETGAASAPPEIKLFSEILKVADKYDRLTAMSLNQPPVSEVVAIKHLRKNSRLYKQNVVTALSNCINILPVGACLDFSNGEKGLVVAENPNDLLHPMILNFKDNQLYDLSDPDVASNLIIVDIMKTMDNRIRIDENSLNHFVADPSLKKTAERFRQNKAKISKKRMQS